MTVALVVVIVALLARDVWVTRAANADRQRLVSALIARNGRELAGLDRVNGADAKAKLEPAEQRQAVPYGFDG